MHRFGSRRQAHPGALYAAARRLTPDGTLCNHVGISIDRIGLRKAKTMTQDTKLLKVADVCDRLQMGKSKVFEFIATGQLESLKIDGARRITEAQLADFIARRTSATRASA
jgi:predicted DNA-binding transcriptional regulator AlpA